MLSLDYPGAAVSCHDVLCAGVVAVHVVACSASRGISLLRGSVGSAKVDLNLGKCWNDKISMNICPGTLALILALTIRKSFVEEWGGQTWILEGGYLGQNPVRYSMTTWANAWYSRYFWLVLLDFFEPVIFLTSNLDCGGARAGLVSPLFNRECATHEECNLYMRQMDKK